MSFDQHAFISYAHVDNFATPDEERGWVTRFQQQLAAYLSTEIAAEARLWRDDQLRGNQIFSEEIVAQFATTAVLLAVVSPRYVESEWCMREIGEFCAAAERNGGVIVGHKTRIVPILLKPMPAEWRQRLPAPLRADETLGYPFYEEVEGRRTLRLDPSLGNGEAYRRNVMFLAEDIGDVIRKLQHAGTAPGPVAHAGSGPTVYLAECAADRRDDRERLRAELKAHHVRVLPEQRLPELQDEYVAEVERLLAQCQLSIHLVGAGYGAAPDGPGMKSGVMLQNECAISRSRRAGLARLIWLPAGTQARDEPQAHFLAALQSSAELQSGADLFTGTLERFKAVMHAALDKLRRPPEPEPAPDDAPAGLFLLCDAQDRKATVGLRKLLRERGIAVSLPAFEGDAAAVREANQRLAATSAAVLVYYGAGGEAWKRTTDNELKKQLGLLFGRNLPPVWTFLAEPTSGDKDDLVDMEEPHLIDGRGTLVEQRLQPLLDVLATWERAA